MLLNGLSRTNGQSVSVSGSRRRSPYTMMQPVSHLMRRERSRTLLLRNSLWHRCMVEHFSGFRVDQAQPKFFGTAAETVNQACAMELQISTSAGIAVGEFAA